VNSSIGWESLIAPSGGRNSGRAVRGTGVDAGVFGGCLREPRGKLWIGMESRLQAKEDKREKRKSTPYMKNAHTEVFIEDES
jgi:hypothetical protein